MWDSIRRFLEGSMWHECHLPSLYALFWSATHWCHTTKSLSKGMKWHSDMSKQSPVKLHDSRLKNKQASYSARCSLIHKVRITSAQPTCALQLKKGKAKLLRLNNSKQRSGFRNLAWTGICHEAWMAGTKKPPCIILNIKHEASIIT